MNAVMSESDFRKRIRFGIDDKTARVFFFYGEEDYLKHAAVETAKAGLVSDLSFDYVYLGSSDYSEEALASALEVPPMFSAFRLICVSVNLKDLRPNEINGLISVMSGVDPAGNCVMLLNLPADGFDPGTDKKPSALFKKLAEAAVPVRFDRVTGAKLNGWVSKHYAGHRLLADPSVCAFTVGYCGTDMFRLASEIDKISCLVLSRGRDRVTEEDVRTAGCPVSEFDAFALTNAIVAGDHRRALEVLGYVRSQKTEPALVMGEITRVICDMTAADACRRAGMPPEKISAVTGIKPFPLSRYLNALEKTDPGKLRQALEAARRADEGVKGLGRDYLPIEQLICSL